MQSGYGHTIDNCVGISCILFKPELQITQDQLASDVVIFLSKEKDWSQIERV